MTPLTNFRKKKDDKLILLEEIAYMLHKPKNGKRITDIYYFGIFMVMCSNIVTQLCFRVFTELKNERCKYI